jgi:hypothetical protein
MAVGLKTPSRGLHRAEHALDLLRTVKKLGDDDEIVTFDTPARRAGARLFISRCPDSG